jgi:manganese-dependent ADP-ribose/CDP-alcohol diphosphatase
MLIISHLDRYDVSILGWPPGHPRHEAAVALLNAKNPNTEQNSNNGLHGLDKRFVKFGGGLSETQLQWLDEQLESCRRAGERVIVCCHLPFHPATCNPTCLSWNYDVLLGKLQAASDVVVATLAGHAHRDGYHCDEFSIHHRVCKAVLVRF